MYPIELEEKIKNLQKLKKELSQQPPKNPHPEGNLTQTTPKGSEHNDPHPHLSKNREKKNNYLGHSTSPPPVESNTSAPNQSRKSYQNKHDTLPPVESNTGAPKPSRKSYQNKHKSPPPQVQKLLRPNLNQLKRLNNIAFQGLQSKSVNIETHTVEKDENVNIEEKYASNDPEMPMTSPIQERQSSFVNNGEYVNKRKCPRCRATGFGIKEVDDKTRIICYVPVKIYAKKRVCTRCMHEF